MIIQSNRKSELLLPDMTFWTMTINQSVTEIYKNYKVLCPTILFAEIYNDVKGAKKRLKNPFEVVYIDPWQILVKNELEGQPIFQESSIAPAHLKSVQDMNEDEKEIVENAKKVIKAFDKDDKFLSNRRYPILNDALVSFAKSPYQKLTWAKFIQRFKKVSRGTIFQNALPLAKTLKANKNTVRAAIENVLSEYAKMYPINNFQKAFAFSKLILENNSVGFCNETFIPMLETHFGLNKTHWNSTRDSLTSSHIGKSFPYTWYALYHHIAFLLYLNENTHTARVGSRDFEYLYYLYFPNVLFVSADAQHEKYVTGAGVIKSRHNGSFAYIPHKNDNPEEHCKVMKYIKEGVLY